MRMRSFFRPWPLVLALAVLAGGAWYGLPAQVAPWLVAANRHSAGLSAAVVDTGTHRVHYLQRGSGPVVVLLHGIFAEKDHWVDFARAFPEGYRLVIPDLPGFGQTGRDPARPYDYAAQMAYLQAFLDTLDVQQAHIAGSSMGATLGALLALHAPQRVRSLAFIGAPHGLRTAQGSDMDRAIDAGRAPLVPQDAAQFEAMLGLVFAQRPFLPYPVRAQAQAQALAQAASNQQVWEAQLRDRFLLDGVLWRLQTPLLALWGGQDRVFHVSGAARLRELLPAAQLQVLEEVGHLPMMEAPASSAQAYAAFLALQPQP